MHQPRFLPASIKFRSVLSSGHRALLRSKAGFLLSGHAALVLAVLICVHSAAVASSRTCSNDFYYDTCCFTQQPTGTAVVCEDSDSDLQSSFTAKFYGISGGDESTTTWQWFKTVNGVETATDNTGYGWTATLTLYGWSPNDVGDYRCQFFESPLNGVGCGIAWSDYCSYRVVDAMRFISVPPPDQTVCAGGTASFSVQASNAVAYQWEDNFNQVVLPLTLAHGTVISGSATPTLTFSNVNAQDDIQGRYHCRVFGQSGCGTSISRNAKLTVAGGAARITSEASPATKTVCRGDTAVFSVAATGENVQYQWYKHFKSSGESKPVSDGKWLLEQTVFSGSTTNTLTLTNIGTQADGPYFCRVSNYCGTDDSAEVNLTVTSLEAKILNITIANQATDIPDTACATNPPSAGHVFITVQTNTNDPLYYQWYKRTPPSANFVEIVDGDQGTGSNRTNITGAKTSQIALTKLHTTDMGDYRCVISEDPMFPACGTAESPPKTLTVTSSSSIINIVYPVDQQVCLGSDATFSITADGARRYTWYMRSGGVETPVTNDDPLPNGTVVEGADTPTLVLHGVQSADMGTQFRCMAENACGSNVSTYATLSAIPVSAPIITTQPPSSLSVCVGSLAVLSVSATGDNLTYQWTRNNVDLANNDTYSNVNAPSLGVLIDSAFAQANFRCRITSNVCSTASVTSTATSLSRKNPITIAEQPTTPQHFCGTGGTATFSVTATGANPKTYQWRRNGAPVLNSSPGVSGATTDTLTLSSLNAAATGYYACTVTNPCGEETSDQAALSVIDTSAPFTTQPTPQSICGVGTVTFSVVAAGLPDMGTTYRWQRRYAGGGFANLSDGSGISGSQTSTLTLTDADAGDLADYRCRATNECGTFNSAPAALTMDTLAIIDKSPVSQTVCNGKTAVFTVQASGPNLTYRWQSRKGAQVYLNLSDGDGVSGALTNTLTLTNVNDADAKIYRCRATNTCGTVASDPATLTVGLPVAADLDGDCDVDANDLAQFNTCASGPDIPFAGGCGKADFDQDGDVDMDDFAILQRCYSGSGMPANPNCLN